ncbi:MAG: enoyl-CoA hydratase [Rhodospirillaceae bacterium]|nr:MAG: enoyl-CoA hydratase [Rhodospirillaceae bacterium]
MDYEFIKVEAKAGVTTIALNRPEVMNAINSTMHHELQAAFDAFAADPAQLICVVTGIGQKAFCAGSDLKAAVAGDIPTYPKNGYAGFIERFDLFKPVIAAVNGVCLGGGFEFALACDIIIASDNASFGLPEPRVGVIALAGGIHRIVRQIGMKRAMGLLLTSERVTAQQGFDLGFVNEVVAQSELQAAVDRYCRRILINSPVAIRTTKEVAMRGLDEPDLATAIRNQADYPGFRTMLASEDIKEGPKAFAEKRTPVWRGR